MQVYYFKHAVMEKFILTLSVYGYKCWICK